VAWPLGIHAQQPIGSRRIGWLDIFPENDPSSQARRTAFLETVEKLGWTVGRNLGDEFNGERDSIETATDSGDDRSIGVAERRAVTA
jgi:hypothetical protein